MRPTSIVGQLGVDRGICGHGPSCSKQQRIAVRHGPGHVLRGDNCTRAGLVFDDHRLPQALGKFLAYEPCQEVIAAAGSEANDNPNGSRRIGWIGLSQYRQAWNDRRSDRRKTYHNAAARRLELAWHTSSRGETSHRASRGFERYHL